MSELSKKDSPNLLVGVIGCLGGMFIHLVIGSVYQWGIINVYVTSYYALDDQSLTLESTAIAFPIMMICIGMTMKAGLTLTKSSHPLIVMVTGQILNASMILVSSFMPNIYLFILFYGVLFGLTAGLSFTNAMFECNKYLVGKRMYVNGLILVGTGSGPVIFGIFSYKFLNPDELQPLNGYYHGNQALQQIVNKTPILLQWLSLLYLVIGLLGVLMMTPVCLYNRRKQKQQSQLLQNLQQKSQIYVIQNDQSQKSIEKKKITIVSYINYESEACSVRQAVKTKVFLITILMAILASCGCFLIIGNYKTYVKGIIHDDKLLTTIGVVGAVGNGCCRFFWNLFFSKTGYKTVCVVILSILVVVFSTIRFSTTIPELYLLEVFVISSCFGGIFVITPTASLYIYGIRTGTNIYGIYWSVFSIANFIAYVYVSQLSKLIGFDGIIYVCLGMVLCAIPLVCFTKFQGPWANGTTHLEFFASDEQEKKKKLTSGDPLSQGLIR